MNIGIIGHGPASGNAIAPLIEPLETMGHTIYKYAFHEHVANVWGVREEDIYDADTFNPDDIYTLNGKLDLVIYGTGSCHYIETSVPKYAKKHGVRSVSILDIFWGSIEGLANRYKEQPDILIVPNTYAKKRIIDNHIMPPDSVFPLGNPHYDRLTKLKDNGNLYITDELEKKKPISIVVVSEPSANTDKSRTNEKIQSVFNLLFGLEEQYSFKFDEIVYCNHPREDDSYFNDTLKSHSNIRRKQTDSFTEAISAAFVIGNDSTILYELCMIEKPVFFLRNTTVESLKAHIIDNEPLPLESYLVEENATDKVSVFIHKYLRAIKA